jgi:hypothetical protein
MGGGRRERKGGGGERGRGKEVGRERERVREIIYLATKVQQHFNTKERDLRYFQTLPSPRREAHTQQKGGSPIHCHFRLSHTPDIATTEGGS